MREPGFYWVYCAGMGWTVGEWLYQTESWCVLGWINKHWEDSDFAVIGPKIERPPQPDFNKIRSNT